MLCSFIRRRDSCVLVFCLFDNIFLTISVCICFFFRSSVRFISFRCFVLFRDCTNLIEANRRRPTVNRWVLAHQLAPLAATDHRPICLRVDWDVYSILYMRLVNCNDNNNNNGVFVFFLS